MSLYQLLLSPSGRDTNTVVTLPFTMTQQCSIAANAAEKEQR